MAPGPRDYRAATTHALFLLSQGNCYSPDCDRRVIVWIDSNTPTVDTHIAHIRGAHSGSPRYDPTMTDDERRAFANLILLCKPHHDLIDKIRPEDHPVEVLLQWKADREGSDIGELSALGAVSEDRLEDLIIEAVRQAGPTREVSVELDGAFLLDFSAGVLPIAGWQEILRLNPHLAGNEKVLVTTVRNVGTLRTSVVGVDTYMGLLADRSVMPFTMMGRNDYPIQNPQLPKALESGDQLAWLTSLGTIEMMRAAARAADTKIEPAEIWSAVRLGSGEQVESDRHSFGLLPLSP